MLDSAHSQGPGGPAVIHCAFPPITTESEILWRPSGYALITGQKSLGRNHPFLKSESPCVIQSLPFSLPMLNPQISVMQASSSIENP